jgi:hypothetical protein
MRAKTTSNLAEVLHLAGRAEEAAAALGEAIRLHEQKGNVAAARDCHDLARWTTSAPPAAPG